MNGTINNIQHAIIDKLHGYRSDAYGVGHAIISPSPTELEALWFLATLLVQLNYIGRQIRSAAA